MGYRVLIIGCGELGSRHLQAIASLPEVTCIEVIEPDVAAQKIADDRVRDVAGSAAVHRIKWLDSLKAASKSGDLCIIATTAKNRAQVFYETVDTLDYSKFILEKLVAQSSGDVQALVEFSREKHLSIWINCKMRAYPFHQKLRELVQPDDAITINTVGGNWGLATNGIHVADTFAFYDRSPSIRSSGSFIDPILHPSKRGGEFFDLSGALSGYTEKGGRLHISYSSTSDDPGHMSISSANFRSVIDHSQRWAFFSEVNSGWKWIHVPFEDSILVSQMTKHFAMDILVGNNCTLPTLEESLTSHKFILDELKPHFSRLLNKEIERCPVT